MGCWRRSRENEGGFTLRYNVSRGNHADVKVYEWLHVPAVSYRIAAPLLLQAELALWKRHTREGSSNVDVTLHADFWARISDARCW